MRTLQRVARSLADRLGRGSVAARLLRPLYARLLLVLGAGRGIPWTINGVEYRIDPRYRHRMGATYEAPVAAWLRAQVRPGQLCLDVGANVGVYVLQLARWSAPHGRVIAFEPSPDASQALERHVRMNGLADRVSVEPAAVGAERGEAVLYAAAADGMTRLHEPNPSLAGLAKPLAVPVVSLDDWCGERGLAPDWLIVDVEGYELDVLAGAASLLRARGAELGVVVELHPGAWPAQGLDRAAVARRLAALGRRPVPLTGQSDALMTHGVVRLAAE